MLPTPGTVEQAIRAWSPRGVPEEAAGFARAVVTAASPASPARARSLLWTTSRLAAWGLSVGLQPIPEVLLSPSVIERYVAVGMAGWRESARRTARTNLRFVAVRIVPDRWPPLPASLRRDQAKDPYTTSEIEGFFALAAAQPTEARRRQVTGLLCLGLGAGLERGELRGVRGRHVVERSGGVVIVIEGRRARAVPVLARYHAPLLESAAFAGERFVIGGRSPTRRNVTTDLLGRVSGGDDLPRIDPGRLRSTWLAEHLERLGIRALFAAAGIRCSQRLGDLAAKLPPPSEAILVELLGGKT